MFDRWMHTFQTVLLCSLICKIKGVYRTRPHPVMTITRYEILFFPRQSYCLNLLKAIEDTGGYNGLHVNCQRYLCRYYEGRGKFCATNGKHTKTFRNQCLLCAKGCEELNMNRHMYRPKYNGKCGDRDPITTDGAYTSAEVTSAPSQSTRPSTSESRTELTRTYFDTTTSDEVEESSFAIVVNGSTVVVSTAQPFTSPFTSATTPGSPLLSTSLSTSFTSTLKTYEETSETESQSQPDKTTIHISDDQLTTLETDFMVTLPSEILASTELENVDQETTSSSTPFVNPTTRQENVIGTTGLDLLGEQVLLAPVGEKQIKCLDEKHDLLLPTLKYRINTYSGEQLCVKNTKHFPIDCESMKQVTRYGGFSSSIPVLPNFVKAG